MPEPTAPIRVLLLADSHLGFDHPVRPRVQRRRRGEDFLANHGRALRAAVEMGVDLVVHGGDLFHKPGVPASLVHQAFAPIKTVADEGIPVFVVPGNHERSRIPFDWLARHPGVHVFATPGTTTVEVGSVRVAVSGVPFQRKDARGRFAGIVEDSAWAEHQAEVRLLVTHQAFEGATVGPSDFVFRRNHDTLRMADVPPVFAAVLSGHIHRHQVLERDLSHRPVSVPVFYPGSVERTAFAEMGEAKGFMTLDLEPGADGGRVRAWQFHDLGARPMVTRTLEVRGHDAGGLERALRDAVAAEAADAVLRIRLDGVLAPGATDALSAENLRRLTPSTMNLEVLTPGPRPWAGKRRSRPRPFRDPAELQLDL